MIKKALLISLLLCAGIAKSDILNVPNQFSSIQMAIDSASANDTILIANGLYFENLTIRGKSVFLTSEILNSGNIQDVFNTIIDGSNYIDIDTSCVIRVMEPASRNTVVQGLTLQGGQGSVYSATTLSVIEGGGLYIQRSSPTIRWNLIRNNRCDRSGAVPSSGAAGIHTLNDTSLIYGNVITDNIGLYGCGVTLNNSNALFTNNLIYNNRGGQDFGGGGMMVFCEMANYTAQVINNTIVSNIAFGTGGAFAGRSGGVFNIDCDNTVFRNNIVYGNYDRTGLELDNSGGNGLVFEYNITPSYTGTNSDVNPSLLSSFLAPDTSYAIDFGDPDTSFNDIEDSSNPGNAMFPSQGTLLNDAGVYGGPFAGILPLQLHPVYNDNRNSIVYPNSVPFDTTLISFQIRNLGSDVLQIDSIRIQGNNLLTSNASDGMEIGVTRNFDVNMEWVFPNSFSDTIMIYHNDTNTANPQLISLDVTVVSVFLT